jgi:hypothetical protein
MQGTATQHETAVMFQQLAQGHQLVQQGLSTPPPVPTVAAEYNHNHPSSTTVQQLGTVAGYNSRV